VTVRSRVSPVLGREDVEHPGDGEFLKLSSPGGRAASGQSGGRYAPGAPDRAAEANRNSIIVRPGKSVRDLGRAYAATPAVYEVLGRYGRQFSGQR
jgi:hypothetical protein